MRFHSKFSVFRRGLGAAAIAVAGSACVAAPPRPAEMAAPVEAPRERPSVTDAIVRARMDKYHRPGAAIAVTRNGSILWTRAYGFADLEAKTPMTAETVFPVCSLSKPVLLVAVMQLADRLATQRGAPLAAVLDQNIEELASPPGAARIRVRHPLFPDAPISLRMLLSHVSGIRDHFGLIPHSVKVDPPAFAPADLLDLNGAIQAYLTPGGPRFDPEGFLPGPPGSAAVYSSVASSITALFVAAASQGSFESYTNSAIFEPLGMRSTAWRLHDLTSRRSSALPVALPYQWQSVNGGAPSSTRVTPLFWEHTFFPAASLRSTVVDYARFVAALAGQGGHSSLLSDEALREVLRVQYPNLDPARGLILTRMTLAGIRVAVHAGQNNGYRTQMAFTPPEASPDGDTYGVVILTNGDYAPGAETLEAELGDEILRRAIKGDLDQ